MSDKTIQTDGCTGFPDKIAGHDLTMCCSIHDDGGTDGQLLDCLDVAVDGEWLLIVLVGIGVAAMRIGRPIYNLAQRIGWLPKTKGSKF